MGCGGSKQEHTVDLPGSRPSAIHISVLKELSYQKVMVNNDGVQALIEFATSEFAEENMLFWAAAQKFSKAEGADLAKLGAEIVDKYLCSSAEFQVNLPSNLAAPFSKASAQGSYEWKHGMFGDTNQGQLGEIYRLIMRDTFARFKYSDKAKDLLEICPELAQEPEADAVKEAAGPTEESKDVARKSRADTSLAARLGKWREGCGCDRITLWLIDPKSNNMFNVCSTELGNTMIMIPVGVGLAGKAAQKGQDMFITDAYTDPTFSRDIDKATGFRTKQVCCVVLRKADGAKPMAVVQLINKVEGQGKKFTAKDAELIKFDLPAILPIFENYERTSISRWNEVEA
jgi:hypothetical protein